MSATSAASAESAAASAAVGAEHTQRLEARMIEFRRLYECAQSLEVLRDFAEEELCPSDQEQSSRKYSQYRVGSATKLAVVSAARDLITESFRYAAAAEGLLDKVAINASEGLDYYDRDFTRWMRNVEGIYVDAAADFTIPTVHFQRVFGSGFEDAPKTPIVTPQLMQDGSLVCTAGVRRSAEGDKLDVDSVLPIEVEVAIDSYEPHFACEVNALLKLLAEKLNVPCAVTGRTVKRAES